MTRQTDAGVSNRDRYRSSSLTQKLKTYWVLMEKHEGEETGWVRFSPVDGWIYTSLFAGATRFESEDEAVAVAVEQYPTERLYPRLVKPVRK